MASKTCVCGMEIESDDQFCPYCGREQRATQATQPLETAATEAMPAYGGAPAPAPVYEPYPTAMAAQATTPSYGDSYAANVGAGIDPPTAIPERPLYQPQATQSSVPSTGAAVSPSYGADTYGSGAGNGGATWARTPAQIGTQTPARDANGTWASSSSFPAANPYAQQPGTLSSGTMVNGRPANSGGGGVLKGIGAVGAAFLVILAKFGGAIASLGIFKWFLLIWALGHGFGGIILIVILISIIGGIVWRTQST